MTRQTVRLLITQGLGYCCPWFFFRHFRRTAQIAARLGVTPRAIRYAKAEKGSCEGCAGCMNLKVTLEGTARKIALPRAHGNPVNVSRQVERGAREVEPDGEPSRGD